MKIAVFSDVHGDLKALKTVLGQIKERNADEIIFLGDIFQRGNEELECLELLRNSEIVCLKGNCELYLANGVDIDPRCGVSQGVLRHRERKAFGRAGAVR